MTTIIFSLGQLIASDLNTLKTNFQSALSDEGNTATGNDVWEWIKGYLPRLRLNQISLEELCTEFNTHFSMTMSASDFTTHFNSMSRVDESSLARITELTDFLDEHPDIKVLLVSHTNFSHLNYILEQLESVIPNCQSGIIRSETTDEPGTNILFATSMYAQCEKHLDTLQWAMNALKVDLEQPIVSFLNTIQAIEHAEQFTYIPANGSLNMNSVIEAIEEHHVPSFRPSP